VYNASDHRPVGAPSKEAATPQVPLTSSEQKPSRDEQEGENGHLSSSNFDALGDALPEGAIARIGTTRLHTNGFAHSVAFSPDGRLLAYVDSLRSVHISEAVEGKALFDFLHENARSQEITELAFSPDNRLLAMGGCWNEEVQLLDVTKQRVTMTVTNPGQSPKSLGRTFTFTPDGGTLIVGGKDGAMHFWDLATGKEQAALPETGGFVASLTLTADSGSALTAHANGALHLWDVKNRKHVRKLVPTAKYPYFSALDPTGKRVVLATGATQLELWDSGGERHDQIHTTAPVVGLGFAPDGTLLRVAEGNGDVTTWDIQTGKLRLTLHCEGIPPRLAFDADMGPMPAAWFGKDGKMMAWATAGAIRPWDLTTGQEIPRPSFFRLGIKWAGFSADGRLVRVGGGGGELGIWDAATGQVRIPPRKTDLLWYMHYRPALDRGSVVGVAHGTEPVPKLESGGGRILVWKSTGDADPVPLGDQDEAARAAVLSPDNRFIVATQVSGRIGVYDAKTGKLVRAFAGRERESHPTFSPDGSLLATSSFERVRLYDFASGNVVRELNGSFGAGCLAFAPDGRTLANIQGARPHAGTPGPPPGTICLWDTHSGLQLRQIPAGPIGAPALAFSPDGRLIALCGSDRALRLWEAASGQLRRRYYGHRSSVLSADFSPDGRRLVSASSDGTALVWHVFDPGPEGHPDPDLNDLWTKLAQAGSAAHKAIGALLAAKGTADFVGAHVKPARKPSGEQVQTWLTGLGNPELEDREAAQKELATVVDMIEPELRRAFEESDNLEVRIRLTTLLESISHLETRPEQLRELRAVEVLEHLRSSEARRALVELTKGEPGAALTRAAKAALGRWNGK
jgi:WD40 repeat protein